MTAVQLTDVDARRIAGKIVAACAGERPGALLAALTTAIAVIIAQAADAHDDDEEIDELVEEIADALQGKLRRLVAKERGR